MKENLNKEIGKLTKNNKQKSDDIKNLNTQIDKLKIEKINIENNSKKIINQLNLEKKNLEEKNIN